jgi:hypothetical protein
MWTTAESRLKLNEVLQAPLQVRAGTNDLPAHSVTNLQAIIRDLDAPRQEQVLRAKANELLIMRPRVSPDLVSLLDQYRSALEWYLRNRDKVPLGPGPSVPPKPGRTAAAKETIKQLDALDAYRESILSKQAKPPKQITSPKPEATTQSN